MAIHQLSVFVENKKGSLLEITRAISEKGIDIRALSIADTQDYGILRLIVSDTMAAAETLKRMDCIVSVTPVLGVEIADEPGSLSAVLALLADAGVAVEYMYAFISVSGHNAYVVLRVKDNDEAAALLQKGGVRILTEEDIAKL